VAKGRLWYLVAAVDDEPRTYRVSRIQAAEILDSAAARPPDFDLASFWAESSASLVANLPRYPIAVRVAPEVIRRLWIPGAYARVEQVGEPESDGWIPVALVLQSVAEACSYVLGFGDRMAVVEPASLRERVIQVAREVISLYTQAADRAEPASVGARSGQATVAASSGVAQR
jgi:predicted DNA-binding transcriptional regulator YafY